MAAAQANQPWLTWVIRRSYGNKLFQNHLEIRQAFLSSFYTVPPTAWRSNLGILSFITCIHRLNLYIKLDVDSWAFPAASCLFQCHFLPSFHPVSCNQYWIDSYIKHVVIRAHMNEFLCSLYEKNSRNALTQKLFLYFNELAISSHAQENARSSLWNIFLMTSALPRSIIEVIERCRRLLQEINIAFLEPCR